MKEFEKWLKSIPIIDVAISFPKQEKAMFDLGFDMGAGKGWEAALEWVLKLHKEPESDIMELGIEIEQELSNNQTDNSPD